MHEPIEFRCRSREFLWRWFLRLGDRGKRKYDWMCIRHGTFMFTHSTAQQAMGKPSSDVHGPKIVSYPSNKTLYNTTSLFLGRGFVVLKPDIMISKRTLFWLLADRVSIQHFFFIRIF